MIAMTGFQFLDQTQFPEFVDLYRFDIDSRVAGGMRTARTVLAEQRGIAPMHGFFESDITHHLLSGYDSRLDKPSRSNAGVGSPFVSAAFRPSGSMLQGMQGRADFEDSALFRIRVHRSRVVVPQIDNYGSAVSSQHGKY